MLRGGRGGLGGHGVGGSPAAVARALRGVDAFRKPARDLYAEGTVFGALLTALLALAVVGVLIVFVRDALRVRPVTRVDVDHSEDGSLMLNFRVTLPELSCEYATVDAFDALGHRSVNISGAFVWKKPIQRVGAPASEVPLRVTSAQKVLEPPEYYDNPADGDAFAAKKEEDHYGNRKAAIELTEKSFAKMIEAHKVVLVNFHAPWCPHCRRLAPVWEDAALQLSRREVAKSPSRRYPWSVALASVDCTLPDSGKLCRDQHVNAYPTVRVFRRGSDSDPHSGDVHRRGHTTHEAYHGQRTAQALVEFAQKVLDEVVAEETTSKAPPRRLGSGTDADADGVADSVVTSRGCIIEGTLKVARVPGTLEITPFSLGHTFDASAINLTHTVNHLSFGAHAVGARPSKLRSARQRRVWRRIPKDMGGAFANNSSKPFVSYEDSISHEHFVRVVATRYVPWGVRDDDADSEQPVNLFQYTVGSNTLKTEEKVSVAHRTDLQSHIEDGYEETLPPAIRFRYDTSPLLVTVTEERQPMLSAILGAMGICGGLYFAATMVEAFLQALAYTAKRTMTKDV